MSRSCPQQFRAVSQPLNWGGELFLVIPEWPRRYAICSNSENNADQDIPVMSTNMPSPVLDKILTCKTNDGLLQFLRYALVGGVAFVVDFVSLHLLTENLGLHYLQSAALAFVLGPDRVWRAQ